MSNALQKIESEDSAALQTEKDVQAAAGTMYAGEYQSTLFFKKKDCKRGTDGYLIWP